MMAALYKTKKELKQSIGTLFRYRETSVFGPEFADGRMLTVVGPNERERKWFANVWTENGIIVKVK